MGYDFDKIRSELGELKASQELMIGIDGLAAMANKGEDVTPGFRSLANGLTDNVSDAESSPLNSGQQQQLQTDAEVLKYLRKLAYEYIALKKIFKI